MAESPHFEVGRFCAGCPNGTILHTGCEVNGTVNKSPVPTTINELNPVPTPVVKGGS